MIGLIGAVAQFFGGWQNILKWSAIITVVCLAYSWVYDRGYTEGKDDVQSEWNAEKAKQAMADAEAESEWKAKVEAANKQASAQAAKFEAERQRLKKEFQSMEDMYRDYLKRRREAGGVCRLDPVDRCVWSAANAGTDSLRGPGLPGGQCVTRALSGDAARSP